MKKRLGQTGPLNEGKKDSDGSTTERTVIVERTFLDRLIIS